MTRLLPPLLLTGGPAVGKSSTACALAKITPRTAYLDVDDLRHLVKNGGAAPWEGDDGLAQQRLGVRNAALLACNFVAAGFQVTVSDVVSPTTLTDYRDLVPGVVVIRLLVSLEEARRRARTRKVYLTDDEFEMIHREQATSLAANHQLDVTQFSQQEQLRVVHQLWTEHG